MRRPRNLQADLTVPEVAVLLGCTVQTVYDKVRRGTLPQAGKMPITIRCAAVWQYAQRRKGGPHGH